MRVLFSGFRKKLFKDETSLFSGAFMEESDFLRSDQTLAAIYRAAIAGGHDVEGPRMVGFQEDLSGYDCVVSEMSVPNVFGANGLVNMLWAVRHYRKVAFVVGHWDIKSMYGGLDQLRRKPEKMFGGFIEYDDSLLYDDREFAPDALGMILESAAPSAINAWDWGDHGLLGTKYNNGFRYFFDPTSLITAPEEVKVDFGARERKWVTGTFEPFAVKQILETKTRWPNEVYGTSNNGGLEKLPPDELFSRMSNAIGSFVHGYHHAGSGYYRSRYQQALNCGNVLSVLDQKDLNTLPSQFRHSASRIESMNTDELWHVLHGQRYWFKKSTWSQDRFIHWVNQKFLPEVAAL